MTKSGREGLSVSGSVVFVVGSTATSGLHRTPPLRDGGDCSQCPYFNKAE